MSEITLKSIKEEMRRAVIYCAVNFDSYKEIAASIESGDLIKNVSDKDSMSKLSGSKAKYDLALFEVNSAARSAIREKYLNLGYPDLAKKAFSQVSCEYIQAGLRKYGIKLEDSKIYSDRKNTEHDRKMIALGEKSDESLPWLTICVLILIITSVTIGIFSDQDDRSDQEIKLDAYCASMGKSGCSDTARKLEKNY